MSNFGHSGTSTFDDIVDANPLLFRLHSPTSSNTRFYAESKVLLSSRRAKALGCNDGPDILVSILKGLDEDPSSSTPFEPAAVARHITCWHDSNPGSSDFISLSFNVCFVLWDWKRRRSHQGQREDDFFIIVLKSSELRGIAKLGTEIVNKEEHYKAYNFTQAFDEIIVADIVRPAAILGTMPVSRLEGSIPSWWEKPLASMLSGPHFEEKMFRDFLRKLKVPANKSEDASTREILRFALALITPTMVRDRSTEEGKTPRVHHSDQDTMSEQIAAGKGDGVATNKKRGLSSESRDIPAGTLGSAPQSYPTKRGRRPRDEYRPEDAAGSVGAEVNDQVSIAPQNCSTASAADDSAPKQNKKKKKKKKKKRMSSCGELQQAHQETLMLEQGDREEACPSHLSKVSFLTVNTQRIK